MSRLGLIARRDWTGLGVQTRSYYKHLNPEKTMVVDISNLNGNKQNLDWYPNEMLVQGFPNKLQIIDFLRGLDVVLTAETPYNFELYTLAKQMNVKVANVINWEFFDHNKNPRLPMPDMIIMPSVWYLREAQLFGSKNNVKVKYLHHPVDREEITYRHRTTGIPFHIAGKPASHDRNGTYTFMNAFPDGRVATQSSDLAKHLRARYRHSKIYDNIQNYNELYSIGDILVFPRKYGGNCLPLNEALASGCPVIMPDIEPNNHLLPKEWLVPARRVGQFEPRTVIDIHEVDIQQLFETTQLVRERIAMHSETANQIADKISWTNMKQEWLEFLSS